ncbi:potassium voltage-gated channel subfamily H member 4-like [Betta splendens]|uniref:Potassium voltage-gated channel subfamily H member 4-like n=1 Tax=Betta splendens TaxID=158456 RepID=A0A6P7PBV6_BETSP|nr:potassium voltage-gated channel subfamily H member 4-like [Betta splendens]
MKGQTGQRRNKPAFFPWKTPAEPLMPAGRAAEGKRSGFIVYHNSLAKTLWDVLILLATVYVGVCVPYNISFSTHHTLVSDIVVEVLFIIDIILNFCTSYEGKSGQVVYEARAVARKYIRTWFFVDLLAAVPYDFFYFFHISMTDFIHLVKIVRLLRLLRFFRKSYLHNSAIVLVILMSGFALLAHWIACVWVVIGLSELQSEESWSICWLQQLGKHLDTPYVNSTTGGPSQYSMYITALYFSLSSLTSVGFGNVSANTDAEKLFSICTMFIGALVFSTIFGSVTAILMRTFSHPSSNTAHVIKQESRRVQPSPSERTATCQQGTDDRPWDRKPASRGNERPKRSQAGGNLNKSWC